MRVYQDPAVVPRAVARSPFSDSSTAGKGARYALPFGTFLAIGALVAVVAGDAIVAWYLSYY